MRTRHSNTADNACSLTAGLGSFLFVLLIIVIIAFSTSCTSKSGELDKIQPEKVVVLDSETRSAYDNGRQYYITNYKIKRINHGVIDWFSIVGKAKYECGDTIYHRFIK